MFRFLIPIILIGVAVAGFVMFTNPIYREIVDLRAEKASFNGALANSKALEAERDKLTAKYNDINRENLLKLEKLLPNSVDNIRLIIEIDEVAKPYGMSLRDVKYEPTRKESSEGSPEVVPEETEVSPGNYGAWDLEFSTSGTYSNFMSFLKDLESNLRIVDVSAIQFSPNVSPLPNSPGSEIYRYSFKIKTYWLKN